MDLRTVLSELNPRAGSFTVFAEVRTSRGTASWKSLPELEVDAGDGAYEFLARTLDFSQWHGVMQVFTDTIIDTIPFGDAI